MSKLTTQNLQPQLNSHRLDYLINQLSLGKNKFVNLDFRGISLESLDLSGLDFTNCNFQGTNFSNSNLRHCNFARSNLRGAKLRNTNLTQATLIDTDLTDADLTRARLNHADLNRAIFKRVKCYRTILNNVILPDGSIWSSSNFVGGIFNTLEDLKAKEAEAQKNLTKLASLIFLSGFLIFFHFWAKFVI